MLLPLTCIVIREFFRQHSRWSKAESPVTLNGYLPVGEEVFWPIPPRSRSYGAGSILLNAEIVTIIRTNLMVDLLIDCLSWLHLEAA